MKRLCAALVMLVVWPAWAAYYRGDYETALYVDFLPSEVK